MGECNSYRWIIVAAGAVIGCMAIGAMFSLPVFLRPIADDTGWSTTGISTAMTFGFLAMALASMAWGNLSDRIGPRPVLLIGSALLAGSIAWASRATSLVEFQIVFGVLVGAGVAAIFAPVMACVTGWFDTQRSLAVSLVSAGIGIAPMTVAPVAAQLATHYDWRTCMLIIAGAAAAIMLPASLLIRTPSVVAQPQGAAAESDASGLTVADAIRSPQFAILLLTNFFCCATHSGPIFHTVGYAVSCGIPLVAAVSIYSVEGFSGLFGRIGFGFLGDKFGAKRVLVAGLLVQAFGALAYVGARDLSTFYAVAILFGFVYAGTMPLYAVLIRENFPMHMMGTIIGGISMAGSLGMATGPLAGGLIYDATASYAWLYIGSFGFGIGAFLIAMTFAGDAAGDAGHAHMITLYGIKNCDTMKKARAWLDAHGVAYRFHDYKVDGIDKTRLKAWSKAVGWDVLLNRAGTTFRALADADKSALTESKAIALMLAQPSMIKRPVLEKAGGALLVGFKPDLYAAAFQRAR